MKVLSLFDGMACGMLAMQAAGITVDRYVAYEIDKYAVQTSAHNFSMIEHRGDVFQADFTEFSGFDFVVGGSPCTYWSIAQKNNRETEASGMGWELFSQYVRAVKEAQPRYFIYENNKSMSKAIRESITHAFGFEPICINSALVSAQNRQRLYWVGKRNLDGTYSRVKVEQPEDRGILLRDVLDRIGAKELSEREMAYMVRQTSGGRNHFDFGYIQNSAKDKGACLTANVSKGVPYNVCCEPVSEPCRVGTWPNNAKNQAHDSQQYRIYSTDGKGVTLCGNGGGMGAKTGLYAVPSEPINVTEDGKSQTIKAQYHFTSISNICCYGSTYGSTGVATQTTGPASEQFTGQGKDRDAMKRVYEVKGGQITIKGKQYPIKLKDGYYIIRKLTVSECKRLQTVPEWYEFPVSDSQAYKMLGNGWTVEAIAHLINATQANELADEQLDLFKMLVDKSCERLSKT